MKIKCIYCNIKLLILFLLTLYINSCSNDQREEILERYSSGAKYIVGVYEGTGSNEKFIRREFYQENGKLGRIENLIEESTVTHLDLYPKIKTSEGLEDFLKGSWFKIKNISHSRYDVYETYTMRFSNSKLERSVGIYICNDTEDIRNISSSIIGDINYLENLQIDDYNLAFFASWPTHQTWIDFVNHFHLKPLYLDFPLFAELARRGTYEIDQNTILGDYVTLNKIEIRNNSIGESFLTFHGKKYAPIAYGDEAVSYLNEKGIGMIQINEMTKGVAPLFCEDLKNHFR